MIQIVLRFDLTEQRWAAVIGGQRWTGWQWVYCTGDQIQIQIYVAFNERGDELLVDGRKDAGLVLDEMLQFLGQLVWRFVVLHVRGERCRGRVAAVARRTLERLGQVVGLHVRFEMVGSDEGVVAELALVFRFAGVQLGVAIARSLVAKPFRTEKALKTGGLVVVGRFN